LIHAEANIEDIVKAVNELSSEKAFSMRVDCEKRASDFSLKNFSKEINNIIENL